ncbi:MAG: phage tail protein [Pyrinomonadaceae bacterium]
MAELVLGGIGAAAGSLIPGVGWMVGFNIGVTLGSLLFPPEGPKLERGRVDEIRLQGAQQGSPIPIVYGRNRTAGTIIWATGLIESTTTSTSGGKGGGGGVSTTDYSYSTSFAVLICEGTLSKVRRIWANEKVIYDWRSGGSPTLAPYLDSSKIRVYLGTQTTADAAIEADKGAGNVPAHKGMAYAVFEDLPLAEFGNQIPSLTFEVETDHANLKIALEDVAGRVGLTSTEYDFSAVVAYPTRGMIIGARTEAGRVMEAFARANFFEIVESQGVIKAVLRNGTSVLTIPSDDIGAAEYGDTETARFVETTRSEETELPREFTVSYQSEALDFLQWTQTARRTVRWSENQEQVSFPMSLADAYARYLADAFLMEAWASRSRHKLTVPYKYLRLDPGDVITIPDEGGGTRTVRIVEMSMGMIAQIEIFAVDDDPIIYVDPGLPASIPTGGGASVDSGSVADLVVFETNAAYDFLADSPTLGLVAGRTAAGWKGGDAQIDPRITRSGYGPAVTLASFGSSSSFGYSTADANGVLGSAGPDYELLGGLDVTNTVRVTMTNGDLSSCTLDEMITEMRNLCVLGREIFQFQTATLVSGSTYTLSNLIRFARGTDFLYSELLFGGTIHAQSEAFVLLTNKAMAFGYEPRYIDSTFNFRLIETGKDYSGGLPSFAEPLVLTGAARKPYGPCEISYTGDRTAGSADVEISFTRRVRKRGDLMDYADAPLDETTEEYEIEIWDSALVGLTPIATYTGITSSPWTYDIADQTTDGVFDTEFQVVIYQVSSEPGIGRGHPSIPKLVTLAEE